MHVCVEMTTLFMLMQARGRASVEASNAPRAPLWHPSSSVFATAEPSSGNSPRGSYNHSIQPASCGANLEHQIQEAEVAGPAEDEVVSPHQSRHSHAEMTSQPDTAGVLQSPVDSCHELDVDPGPSSSSWAQPVNQSMAQHRAQQPDMGAACTLPDASSPCKMEGTRGMTVRTAQQAQNGVNPQHAVTHAHEPAVQRARRRQRSSLLRRSISHAVQPLRSDDAEGNAVHSQPGSLDTDVMQQACQTSRATADSLVRALPNRSVRAAANDASDAPANGPARCAAIGPSRAASGSPDVGSVPGPSHSTDGHQAEHSREGQRQQHGSHEAQLTGVVDSFVGAIMQEA